MLAVFLILFFVTPCLAIDEPASLSVDGVWAYMNCKENGDQLYLISYSINYTSLPAESVSQAYLVRLMNGAIELRAVAPYAYHDNGYGSGVAAMYFSADDAPTWEGAYTMKLMGNPGLSWNASVPSDSYTPFDVWQNNPLAVSKIVVAGRIVELANQLETDWGIDMVNISETGQQVLTTYGLAYFVNVVPYLFDVAPSVYAPGESMPSGVIQPEIPPENPRTDYADTFDTLITGGLFDVTPMADWMGVTRGQMSAILYYGCVAIIVIVLARRGQSIRPMMMLSIPVVILGTFVGVPMIISILAGLAGFFFTFYSIAWKPGNA